jgi:hypothetical protein
MYPSFRKTTPPKSVMFVVDYTDGRTAYLWLDGPDRAEEPRINAVARERQDQGALPGGAISGIRRVR